VEAATSRKTEDRQRDLAACVQDVLLGGFEVSGFDHRQWRCGSFCGIGVQAAFGSATGDSGVGGAVVLEGPAEEVGVEVSADREIMGGRVAPDKRSSIWAWLSSHSKCRCLLHPRRRVLFAVRGEAGGSGLPRRRIEHKPT
jgi:hypothetical protein